MKNTLFILFSILIGLHGRAQENLTNRFIKEVDSFVKTTKITDSFEALKGKYDNVYVVNFLTLDSLNKNSSLCFSINYIRNSYDLEYISVNSYFELHKNEEVLLNIPDTSYFKLLAALQIKPLGKDDLCRFVKRLIPEEIGAVTGVKKGMLCCFVKDGLKKKVYENFDDIPSNFSIYKELDWSNGKIEIVKDLSKGK